MSSLQLFSFSLPGKCHRTYIKTKENKTKKSPTTYLKGLNIVSGTPVSLLSLPLLLAPQIYFSYIILIDISNTYQYTKVTFSFPISSPEVINSLDTPAFQTPASIPGTDVQQWCVCRSSFSSPQSQMSH